MSLSAPKIDLSRHLAVEVDGPGATPTTIDAPAFLELAASFFALVRANADEKKLSLDLTGVEIFDKCVALGARTTTMQAAQMCADLAWKQVEGAAPVPHGLAGYADRVREAMQRLPDGQQAKVIAGDWQKLLMRPSVDAPRPLDEMLSIRARPIRVGGKAPAVRFMSGYDGDFTLSTTEDIARQLGAYLYKDVDIDARVSRNADGEIEAGRLEDFTPVHDGDPLPVWREWFKSVGGDDWDAIDDYRAELGR